MTDPGSGDDFAAMLDAFDAKKTVRLNLGDKRNVEVIHIGESSVFCSVSPTQEGYIDREELTDEHGELTVKVGDKLDAFVVSMGDSIVLSRRVDKDHIDIDMLQSAQEGRTPIEGTVTGVNKGGLEVSLGAARGFCPIGQADAQYVEDPQVFVGQTLHFLVREIKEGGRNVILNRRMLLEEERAKQAAVTLEQLKEGDRVEGKVTRLQKFGAFVDLGGVDGLIPMSELSFSRVDDVQEVVSEGDLVTVEILRIEDDPKRPGQKRIGLSLKAAQPDPFDANAHLLKVGVVLEGKVVRTQPFGAFVELAPGLDGLVHISELSHKRVGHPAEVVSVGETVTVRVLKVEPDSRRISLSMKEAQSSEPTRTQAEAVPAGPNLAVGQTVTGKVERHERYGVFVSLSDGKSALLPAAETGTPRGTDLKRVFPMETELTLRVIAIDEKGRIKVSKTAQEQAEERAAVEAYGQSSGGSGSGFGTTLGDLLKKRS